MLNSEDQLYISYMSDIDKGEDYQTPKVDLSDDKGIANALGSIPTAEDDYAANTPYNMIGRAFKRLTHTEGVTDPKIKQYWLDENTEYWFVVITDGVFTNDYGSSYKGDLQGDLNKACESYLMETMPNGTKPQITFMGIKNTENDNLVLPTIVHDRLQVEVAVGATGNGGITDKMSLIADKISGRKRLAADTGPDKKDGDYYYANNSKSVINVRSHLPLLNMAIFSQSTDAEIVAVTHEGKEVAISRTASLRVDGMAGLRGYAYLIGDSQTPMGTGEYQISFDKDVDLSNVIILFEPALEARVSVSVNGKEITDLKKLENLMASDKISVSYKIYEMGTNKEFDVSKLPGETEFKIKVYEENKVVKEIIGKDEILKDYKVKEVETKIIAGITIPGFSPIDFDLVFTPKTYIPTYTITSSVSDEKCVLKEDASKNQNVQVSFTVFSDGKQITNPDEVKVLGPVITTSVKGNDGEITYTDDGKIVFTPKSASSRPGKDAIFDVDVTCTIDTFREEISASEKYQVDASIFEVVFVAPDKTIKKTELYGNTVAATFYVTKEGVRLNKSEVGEDFIITLNKSRKDLKYTTDISDDGTITVTPRSEEKHIKGFFLTYWMKYFTLNASDIEITLEHQRGTVTGTLDVVGGDGAYVFFNVLLWLGIEILVALAVLAYIIRFMTKSRFNSKAKIYYGKIEISGGSYTLNLNHRKSLNKDNKYVWNPFKPITVELMRTSITALYGGMILCHKAYFEARVNPTEGSSRNAKEIYDACKKDGKGIEIQPITGPRTIEKHLDSGITEGERNFYVIPTNPKEAQGVEVQDAYVFCYVIEK